MTKSILLVSHGQPLEKMGGVGLYVLCLAKQFSQLGWEVRVLVPQQSYRNMLEHRSTSWGILSILHHRAWNWKDSWNNGKSKALLENWFSSISIQVCHVHHLSGLPLSLVELLPEKTLRVLTLHDYSIPCARGQLYHRDHFICNGPTPTSCKSCLEPFLFLSGNNAIEERSAIAERILNKFDLLLSPSHDLLQRFQTMFPSIIIEHCQLPLMLSTVQKQTPKRDFIFVGSLIPSKGLHLAILGFLPFANGESSLTIIGHSNAFPTWPNYEQMCRDLANQHPDIRWLGAKTYQETIEELAQHRCLVLPSLWPENSPLTIREASSLGLHIICSHTGGAKELSPNTMTLLYSSPDGVYQKYKEAIRKPTAKPMIWDSPEQHSQNLARQYDSQIHQKQNMSLR